MIHFKPMRGLRSTLDTQPLNDGYVYFCIDDGSFHIDCKDVDGNLQRKQINAKDAETLTGYTFDQIIEAAKNEAATKDNIILHEAKTYTDKKVEDIKSYADGLIDGKAEVEHIHDERYYTETEVDSIIEAAKTDATTKDAVILNESQKYTDAEITKVQNQINTNKQAITDLETSVNQKLEENKDYTDEQIADIPQSDWEQTDENQKDFIKNKPDILTEEDVVQIIKENGGGGTVVGPNATYVEYINDGSTTIITVEIANNTIFSVQGYDSVIIVKPSSLDNLPIWDCYFYVHFTDSKNVSLTLPADMRCNGDSPNYVKPNDIWEISLNKQGGAVCLRN
jgi:hypothetical protein